MAWMKIDLELPDKTEVHGIAGITGLDPDAVVGKLIRVWQWFDKHTRDGNAFGVTYALADRLTGVTGFGEAMMFVGWLEQRDKTLHMPKFDKHTSASAKKRAEAAVRQANFKQNAKLAGNTTTDDKVTQTALPDELPREEKEKKEHVAAKPRAKFDPLAVDLPASLDPGKWESWIKYRRERRLPCTESTIASQVSALASWANPNDSIDASIRNGWQGLFEPKQNGRKQPDSAMPGPARTSDGMVIRMYQPTPEELAEAERQRMEGAA